MDDRFRVFAQFEEPDLKDKARIRHRVNQIALRVFTGNRIQDRFVRELAKRKAVSLKEVLESFEFHFRVRRRVRTPDMADLCCGHGLTGVLFALMERKVERVWCVDRRRPGTFDPIMEAAAVLGPWVRDKVRYVEADVREVQLPPQTTVLGVHACGRRTDWCIDAARRLGGSIAVMPCCYTSAGKEGPQVLRDQLGLDTAMDIDRTYRLEAMGLTVHWSAIPKAISPMNRILIGWKPPRQP
ncbi:MAG: hypothetical protein HN348_05730 [Proteobacteria bacterium]|jgi:hypothetical protein|nr:hypothetical protein [Pseudomonadota bacterium]